MSRYPTGLPHRVRVFCRHCKSTDVRRDAWAEFDEEAQRWVLAEVYDHGHCAACGGEATLDDVRIDEHGNPIPKEGSDDQ